MGTISLQSLKINPAVIKAERIGFMGFGANEVARRHFHWFMADADIHGDHTFSVHHYNTYAPGQLSYTVNRETTTSLDQAIKWLDKLEKQIQKRRS